MRRTRVLQVIPDIAVGGGERMMCQLATGLDRARYEVTVVSLYDSNGSAIEDDLVRGGIEVVHLGKTVGLDARMFVRLAAAVRRLAPDVVHTHRAVLHYLAPALVGRLRTRTAHTIHNLAHREVSGSVRVVQRMAFRAGVAPIAIGQLVAESFERLYGMAPRAIIPHGIPVQHFAHPRVQRAEWRAAAGVPAGAAVITCVARLSTQKNLGALLEALVAMSDVDVLLLVAGEGPLRADLEAHARRLGVAERVRLLGPRSDVPDLLAASDVFVLPSLWEGNPLGVLEAMAAGLPVVATRVGGVPEFVREGETGLLVAPRDVGALAAALRRVVADLPLRRALGGGGRRLVAERFDLSRMIADYEHVYDGLIHPDGDALAT